MSQLLAAEALVAAIGAWTHRPGPLYLRLADAIEHAAAQAAVDDGARLPAERVLAEHLGVSRGTIVAAYAALADRGVVARRRGSGTTLAASGRPAPGSFHRYPVFNRVVSGPPVAIDLAFGAPHLGEDVAGLAVDARHALSGGAPGHGYAPLGLPALREGVAALLEGQGVPTRPDEVLITAGAQGAIRLLTDALVRRGDRVLVEAPTYPGALEVFSRAGAVVLGIRRDAFGPRPEDLDRLLAVQPPALVFLVPTCHNPTGSVMHEQRRREVLAVCRRHDALVVEDLTLAPITFDGAAPPPLAAMEPGVLVVGSFSKSLWGGLRTGWVRADASLVLRLGRLKAAHDLGSGLLDQAVCVAALPTLDGFVERRRAMAVERHAVLSGALAAALPEWKQARPRGGYSLWVRLPAGNAEHFASTALAHGVAVATGSASAPEERFLDHLRLCYTVEPAQLREAVERLARAWRIHTGTAGAADLGVVA